MVGKEGIVTVRVIGESSEDVEQVIESIESLFKGSTRSPVFQNTRDSGFRGYVNIKLERKVGKHEPKA